MLNQIVIVGASHAGVSVAFKLRDLGYTGRIVLLGDESGVPYHRPHLSKQYLLHGLDKDALMQRPATLFEQHAIGYRDDARVEQVDLQKRQICLHDGCTLNYDALVLATGAKLKPLPAVLGVQKATNVYGLRTLADAQRLQTALCPGSHLCVVGAGYIGLEVAAVARQRGLNVTVIEHSAQILSRVACSQTAQRIRELHQTQGVRILEGSGLQQVRMVDDQVTQVLLSDGQILQIDALLVGIGVEPRVELAQQAGLQIDRGICVDAFTRTSDPHVWAIGDCASVLLKTGRQRLESIQNAVDMAAVAADTLLGGTQTYNPIPWFWSDQYESKLQTVGLNHGYTHVVERDSGSDSWSVWYFKDQQLLSVDALNDPRAFMLGKRWLTAAKSPDIQQLSDSSILLTAVALLPNQ